MSKKITIARDESTIRKVHKAIRTGAPTFRHEPTYPDKVRDRWLARYPNLLPLA